MAKRTGKILDRHIVDDLIIGPLQEGRIDRREGFQAIGGLPGGKGHGMLLGNADIKTAAREFFWQIFSAPYHPAWPP